MDYGFHPLQYFGRGAGRAKRRTLMPYKHKRSKFWTASYTDANGRRVQRSTRTTVLKEAKALESRWRSEEWNKQSFDEEPSHTFEELMLMYLTSTKTVKRSFETDRKRAKSLNTYFAGMVVNDLSPSISVDSSTKDGLTGSRTRP